MYSIKFTIITSLSALSQQHTSQAVCEAFNVAKCNLGKVKIEPMLVVGCVLWGQRITPKRMCYDAGWSQGFGGYPSLVWLLACVFANRLIVLIVADH